MKRSIKAGYGAADFGLAGAELLLQLYLLEFYIRVVGLAPWLVGLALALATFWDAVSDPLMGGILDRTRTRWGRFVPYLSGGALLFGIGIVALFHPPLEWGDGLSFAYLLCTYLIVNTGMTIIGVPHMAMAGFLSKDTHERTELYGWRLIFGTVGLFAGILSPLAAAALIQGDVGTLEGMGASRGWGAIFMAIALVGFASVTIVSTWQRSTGEKEKQAADFRLQSLWNDSMDLLKDRFFLPILLAFVILAAGRALNATLALPYYKDSLRLEEAVIQGPILSVFTLCIVLSVPVWVWSGRRFGKKSPALAGLTTLGTMTVIVYPIFPEGQFWGPVGAAVLGGFAVGAIILFESLVTDVADADERRCGISREGLYFGFWRMGQKLTRSIVLAVTGLLLSLIGYEEQATVQTEETRRALTWIFGPGVGGLFLVGAAVFSRMPYKELAGKNSTGA